MCEHIKLTLSKSNTDIGVAKMKLVELASSFSVLGGSVMITSGISGMGVSLNLGLTETALTLVLSRFLSHDSCPNGGHDDPSSTSEILE